MQSTLVTLFSSLLFCGVTFVWAKKTTPEPCLSKLRDSLQETCEDAYNERYDRAMDLDPSERPRKICCALEHMEQCSVAAYYKSGCIGEIPTLKESMKAARLFTAVVTNVTCTEFRGRCSGSDTHKPTLWLFLLALSIVIYAGKIL